MAQRDFLLNTLTGGMFLLLSSCTTIQDDIPQWPCFHGFDRSNKSGESGLLDQWAEEGPDLLWEIAGIGKGYSTVSVAEGLIFTSGMVENQTYVFAFNMEGTLQWKQPNGQSWETEMPWAKTYDGTRSTPTFSEGVIFHLGELGRLAAMDGNNGDELWSMELRDRFIAEIPKYGYSESVLIEDNNLYCCPAGEQGYLVCLDKRNGKLIWANTEIPGPVGFSSLVSFDHEGIHQICGLSATTLFGVDATSGKLLWQVEYMNSRSNNVTDPIYHQGHVFASSGYGKGSILVKLQTEENKIIPETIWQTDLMDNHHGGVILHEGYLYGAGHNARGWACLEFLTGEEVWRFSGKGSLTYADGMLYCLDEWGTMMLVEANPDRYDERGKFEVPEGGKDMYWAHPVVCNKRLYIRHRDKLFAYYIGDPNHDSELSND